MKRGFNYFLIVCLIINFIAYFDYQLQWEQKYNHDTMVKSQIYVEDTSKVDVEKLKEYGLENEIYIFIQADKFHNLEINNKVDNHTIRYTTIEDYEDPNLESFVIYDPLGNSEEELDAKYETELSALFNTPVTSSTGTHHTSNPKYNMFFLIFVLIALISYNFYLVSLKKKEAVLLKCLGYYKKDIFKQLLLNNFIEASIIFSTAMIIFVIAVNPLTTYSLKLTVVCVVTFILVLLFISFYLLKTKKIKTNIFSLIFITVVFIVFSFVSINTLKLMTSNMYEPFYNAAHIVTEAPDLVYIDSMMMGLGGEDEELEFSENLANLVEEEKAVYAQYNEQEEQPPVLNVSVSYFNYVDVYDVNGNVIIPEVGAVYVPEQYKDEVGDTVENGWTEMPVTYIKDGQTLPTFVVPTQYSYYPANQTDMIIQVSDAYGTSVVLPMVEDYETYYNDLLGLDNLDDFSVNYVTKETALSSQVDMFLGVLKENIFKLSLVIIDFIFVFLTFIFIYKQNNLSKIKVKQLLGFKTINMKLYTFYTVLFLLLMLVTNVYIITMLLYLAVMLFSKKYLRELK